MTLEFGLFSLRAELESSKNRVDFESNSRSLELFTALDVCWCERKGKKNVGRLSLSPPLQRKTRSALSAGRSLFPADRIDRGASSTASPPPNLSTATGIAGCSLAVRRHQRPKPSPVTLSPSELLRRFLPKILVGIFSPSNH